MWKLSQDSWFRVDEGNSTWTCNLSGQVIEFGGWGPNFDSAYYRLGMGCKDEKRDNRFELYTKRNQDTTWRENSMINGLNLAKPGSLPFEHLWNCIEALRHTHTLLVVRSLCTLLQVPEPSLNVSSRSSQCPLTVMRLTSTGTFVPSK